eukprot:gene6580-12123_t
MPDSCCAFGCANRRKRGDKSLSFYRIPFGKRSLDPTHPDYVPSVFCYKKTLATSEKKLARFQRIQDRRKRKKELRTDETIEEPGSPGTTEAKMEFTRDKEIQTDPTPNVQQLQEEIVKLRADLLIAKNTSIQQQSSNTRSPSEAMSFASIKDNSSLSALQLKRISHCVLRENLKIALVS